MMIGPFEVNFLLRFEIFTTGRIAPEPKFEGLPSWLLDVSVFEIVMIPLVTLCLDPRQKQFSAFLP